MAVLAEGVVEFILDLRGVWLRHPLLVFLDKLFSFLVLHNRGHGTVRPARHQLRQLGQAWATSSIIYLRQQHGLPAHFLRFACHLVLAGALLSARAVARRQPHALSGSATRTSGDLVWAALSSS